MECHDREPRPKAMKRTCQTQAVNTSQGGFFSFTEITDSTQHRAYNEWHQLDHMPEQFPLPGVQHGQRWVLTPQLRATAAVLTPPFDRTHYLTMYLMSEPLETTLGEFHQLGQRLYKERRWFEPRKSHFAGATLVESMQSAPRVCISPQAVPFRPHTGIHVVVESPMPVSVSSSGDRVAMMTEIPGIAGAWSFVSDERFAALPWQVGNHRITLAWLDTPVDQCDQLHNVLCSTSSPFRSVVFSATLETITAWLWNWFDSRSPLDPSTEAS